MKSIRFIDRRAGYSLASIGLLIGMVVPSIVPAFASAATLDSRSVALSSSTADASGVTYNVSFTPQSTFKSVVMDFCDSSTGPIVGQTCTAPTGLDLTGVTVTFTTNSLGTLGSLTTSGGSIKIPGDGTTTGAASATVFNIAGVHNPTAAGSFYARIYTYSTAASTGYTNATTLGSPVDTGGIALSTTADIGVTAAVRETLTFCVSLAAPTVNCGGTSAPNIILGHGSPKALDSSATDTAGVYTQVSSNAVGGVAVMMKNSNPCGGLMRSGAAVCDIAPVGATNNAIAAGSALFGMKVGTQTTLSGGSGTAAPTSNYSTSTNYGMTYTGASTGVTSAYGDKIYDTSSAPINNVNVPLTFAASVSNTTPAGLYSANMNLIATGTY